MSTDTTPPPVTVATTVTPAVTSTPASEPPEVVALRAAEEARARYEAAIAAAQAQAAQAKAKDESETDQLRRELEELRVKASVVDTIAKTHERDIADARLGALRRMGLAETLSDANALALAPRVDPRDPAGLVELEKWRQANTSLFRAAGPTQAQVLEKLQPAIDRLPKSSLFSTDKLLANIYGGKR